MGFGYDESKRDILCSDAIFVWPESIRSMLAKKHGRDKTKAMDEQLVLIDYLLEHHALGCAWSQAKTFPPVPDGKVPPQL